MANIIIRFEKRDNIVEKFVVYRCLVFDITTVDIEGVSLWYDHDHRNRLSFGKQIVQDVGQPPLSHPRVACRPTAVIKVKNRKGRAWKTLIIGRGVDQHPPVFA
jgi:hypothetical protein